MWVIRGGQQDRLVGRFVEEGAIAVDFPTVPDAEILTRTEIRRFLPTGQSKGALDAQEATLAAFIREIQVGESILLLDTSRGEVVSGTVTGRYEFEGEVSSDDFRHRRAVDWLARHAIGDLPAAVQGVAKQRLDLEQHRDAEWSDYVTQVRNGAIGRDPADRPVRSAAPVRARSPRAAAAPKVAKPPALQMRTCQSCFLQTHPDRMVGDYCRDCAE